MSYLEELIELLGKMAKDRENKIHLSPNDVSNIYNSLQQLQTYHERVNNGDLLIINLLDGKLLFAKENLRFRIIGQRTIEGGNTILEIQQVL